jgi:uncharacterized protein with PIN domain
MAEEPAFMCDAMLGGLARWLRAGGYDAWFDVHVRDGELVRRALEEGRWLVTSDSGILERYAVSEGLVRCVFVPLGLSTTEQVARVMAALKLKLRDSRCMECGGELVEAPAADVETEVPERVKEMGTRLYRCAGCRKVYWRGTHWESIQERLRHAMKLAGAEAAPEDTPIPESDGGGTG